MSEKEEKNLSGWSIEVQDELIAKNYSAVSSYYENLIEIHPEDLSNYIYLGIAYLLQGNDLDAQATWFTPMLEADESSQEVFQNRLCYCLELEAQRQLSLDQLELAWLIFGHLRELQPQNPEFLLNRINLSLQLEYDLSDQFDISQVQSFLSSISEDEIDQNLLFEVYSKSLNHISNVDSSAKLILELLSLLFDLGQNRQAFLDAIFSAATHCFYVLGQIESALTIVNFGLDKSPNYLDFLGILIDFYNNSGNYLQGLSCAKRFLQISPTLELKLLGSHLELKCLLKLGNLWPEIQHAFNRQVSIARDLILSHSLNWSNNLAAVLATSICNLNYFEDNPAKYRELQNNLSQLCQKNIELANYETIIKHRSYNFPITSTTNRKLRIGYLSQSLRKHSIGWLIRWLFKYHDRNQFHIAIYQAHHAIDSFTETYIKPYVDQMYNFGQQSALDIADQIFLDKVDILVDLDSLTFSTGINILALKPAPVQVSWLGWDATGLPAVDYFIGDRYVLPSNADSYYRETLWRLPNSYIAVDGFEVGTPTLRRDLLGIPVDAVIYLSAQNASKRHPDCIQLQMQILRDVPNSLLLIKGLSDQNGLQELFREIAESQGVSLDRLRFLDLDQTELIHRANLEIADIILDTYPYNGATTTLEALWLCLPIVTRVGQQFSARNSYAFMTHAGIEEGIAWTDEEYIMWGIRLGLDQALRTQIVNKLKLSRQRSPLWDTSSFAKDLEHAYQSMHLNKCSEITEG